MKYQKYLFIGIIAAALSSASLSADESYTVRDGAIELPIFFVYASDSEEANTKTDHYTWNYKKALGYQSNPEVISVVGIDNEELNVSVPSIVVSLAD